MTESQNHLCRMKILDIFAQMELKYSYVTYFYWDYLYFCSKMNTANSAKFYFNDEF